MSTTLRSRLARGIAGAALVIAAIATLAVGVYATALKLGDSYVGLGGHGAYESDRGAIASAGTDWRDQLFGWAGSVRVEVASAHDEPIFVGVASADAIDRYLDGVPHTVFEERGGRVVRTDHDGEALAAPTATDVDWTARSDGTGTQTLRWDATDEPQVLLAMNVNGTRPVAVRVESSSVTLAAMPWWVPTGSLAVGGLLLVGGVLTLRPVIRPRSAR